MNEDERLEIKIKIVLRCQANLKRLSRLTNLMLEALESLELPPGVPNVPSGDIEDLGRAIIVYFHAVVEDSLREVARLELAASPDLLLDDVPLAGISATHQPKKFALGALDQHRGKTVDQLIQESIDIFLDQKSFGSIDDIVHMLEWCGIEVSNFRHYFPKLEEMIARRHQIVHRADMEDTGDGYRPVRFPWSKFPTWSAVVSLFVAHLVALLAHGPESEEVAEIISKGRKLR